MKNNLHKNIKYFRLKNNITQTDLAKKIGVSHQTISNYENKVRHADIDMIIELASVFHVSLDELICGEFEDNPQKKQNPILFASQNRGV